VTGRTSVFVFALALSTSAFARDEYTRHFDQTVPTRSGERVMIENKFGDVIVHTHAQQEVAIHADIRVSASDSNQAKEYADKVQILIEPASELSIRTRYPDTQKSMFGMHWSNISYSVHYEVTLPESSPLSVRNAFGAVSVTGMRANSDITNSHGELTFRDGRGTQRLENSFARVEVTNNVGDVTVETSNGAVEAADVKGALLVRDRFAGLNVARISNGVNISNSNGAVQVSDSGGVGDIRNSFGDVGVRGFRGDLTVNNTNGKVIAENVNGSANLKTTFAEVRFANIGHELSIRSNNSRVSGSGVGGTLTIVNSFGATDVSDVRRDLRIESGNGSVVAGKIGGAANLKTSFGMVQATDIGGLLTVENSNGSVKGSNAKGAQIRTSFGSVSLDGIAGPIQVENQNGAVDATSVLRGSCQPISLRTSFSTLRVHLPADASYRVSAKTSFGKISSDFPLSISGSLSNDDVNGTLGSGRCEMRLADNNGAIEILKLGQ
jgi:hypothetical protein